MTQWSQEQISKVQMAGVETLVGLAGKAFDAYERLLELNLRTVRATLSEAREGAEKVLSARDPQELVDLQVELLQPATERALAYRRQLYEILAGTRADFDKVAEAQYTAGKEQMQSFLETFTNSVPAGPPAPLTAWREAVKAATTLYESMQTTAKQAVQVAESSFDSAAETASKGVRRRAEKVSQAAAK
ncbi:phasin family protein [Cupriavidus sp. TMH.W2]|uniref:phasin family protein n=1 Tax=Cupriavidus sp. TMH.W2 TaxID=3434465 RepID=UPI003D785BB3